MHINTTPLHRFHRRRVPMHILLLTFVLSLIAPVNALGDDPSTPRQQEFIITAYYSPLPGQCCYVKGGYVADKILNGEGIAGADGTGVYPGMLAAPPSYAFGTRIDLPGIGILSVHDRGGAIQVLDNGAHRLDVWAGYGEEGLARALAFGVQRVTGTVYPLGSAQPAEQVSLEALPAPLNRLSPFLLDGDLLSVRTEKGERALSVTMLQDSLRTAGYFSGDSTGLFGDETQESLARFIREYGLSEPSDTLTATTAAYLLAAVRRSAAEAPISGFVDEGSNGATYNEAKRTLRFLGYYEGRTDGMYDEKLQSAILNFQKDMGLVGDAQSPGAGRIGPVTMQALRTEWNKKLVASRAEKYADIQRVSRHLEEEGKQLARFLSNGDAGAQVTLLQEMLADRGFFPADKINGNFGDLTRASVIEYQVASGIIGSASDTGAGTVGPSTLAALRQQERTKLYDLVRGRGWEAL